MAEAIRKADALTTPTGPLLQCVYGVYAETTEFRRSLYGNDGYFTAYAGLVMEYRTVISRNYSDTAAFNNFC